MKSFDEFRSYLRALEKRAIYLLLFVFILAQWLAVFIPSVSNIFTTQINTALFSMLILAIFRLFDYRLSKPSIEPHSRNFTEAIDATLATRGAIKSLDLFAHTSSKYFNALRNKHVRIKRVRLLILSDDCILEAPSPKSDQDREVVRQEKNLIIKKWQGMKREGYIDELLIREYCFVPYFHFVVVDGKSAVFGLFRPLEPHPGVTTLSLRSVHDHNALGSELLRDLVHFFGTVYESFSDERG